MDDAKLVRRLRNMDEYEPLGHDGWKAADRIEALIAERDAARDAALEEAAKVADMHDYTTQSCTFADRKAMQIALAIRALKGKSHE